MTMPPWIARVVLMGLMVLIALSLVPTFALAQERPIRIVVGLPPGGTVDIVARLVADKLRDSLGQPVIVENRPGAQTRIAVQAVKAASPDGLTVLVTPGAVMSIYPHMYKQLGYDAFTDFAPVAPLVTWGFGLAVAGDAPYKTIAQFVDYVRANPGTASFASPSAGSTQHFLGLKLATAIGVPLEHIGFKGGKEAVTAVMGGQVPATIQNLGEVVPLHRSGRLRVLATFGTARAMSLPEVATLQELGYPGLEASGWAALYAPAKTPPAVIERLNRAVVLALGDPAVRAKLIEAGVAPSIGSPLDLDRITRQDFAHWREAVRASGYTAD